MKKFNEILAPFAAIYAGAAAMLDTLSDDELQEFVAACYQVSQTNCWVYTYQAANALVDEARHLLKVRGLAEEDPTP